MPRFFVESVSGGQVILTGPDAAHMCRSLRMKPGDTVTLCDTQGFDYQCVVQRLSPEEAALTIIDKHQCENEPSLSVILYQGLPKGEKMDWIVQKAVELGVYEVIPVATNRAVVKLDEKKAAKKTERWNAIALSAAKQCGRSIIPQVTHVKGFGAALEYAAGLDIVLIPYELAKGMEETKRLISSVEPGQSIGIFIGPEGGFEEEEIEKAVNMGALPITLGRRILRTETAGLTILSILMYHLEPSV